MRDSLFGETILWTGKPAVARVPLGYKLVGAVSAVVALVTLCFAVTVATGLHAHVGAMVLFAAWCATITLGAWRLPKIFYAGVEYIVTDRHVIWRRGRIRRTIDRAAISYAIIRWDASLANVGDLVLVRAVPTGALRRTLKLTLTSVEAPDRLWATVRGVEASAPLGHGDRPLAQRLDEGERVLWTGIPLASPWTVRRAFTGVIALLMSAAAVNMLVRAIPTLRRVFRLHALPAASATMLVCGVGLAVALVLTAAVAVGWWASVRPARLARKTRYFVTAQRVLIQRGNEELHLDRSRIAYVIAAPSRRLHDLFLVLDGPQARALAPSGAFAAFGNDETLVPMFASIEDAETVGAILRGAGSLAPLRDAA